MCGKLATAIFEEILLTHADSCARRRRALCRERLLRADNQLQISSGVFQTTLLAAKQL